MTALNRKLLRNLWTMKSQALAIVLVVGCGVAMSVMSLSTLRSLQATRQTYYERYRFADVFASFKRGPQSLQTRVQQLPGVAQADARIVRSVNLIVEGLREPAVGRLISIPDSGPPELNQLYLRRGRMPEPGRMEVVVGESFAVAHNFQPGATVQAILNGRLRTLTIVGIVLSPEHIVEISAGDILPDHRRFGIFWLTSTEMEAAFDMEGACNDLSLTLMRGANEADVIRRLDNLLSDWGGSGSYGRSDQISHRFTSDEIQQLRAMGLVTPVLFMTVAAFMLNMVMTRVLDMQRAQIAALKAFGYYNSEITRHYLKLVGLIVTVGVAGGTGFGIWMGHGLTKLYTQFFRFPVFLFEFDWQTTLLTASVCAMAAFLGTIGTLRAASRLPPAEAMRPKSPGEFRQSVLERFGLLRWMPQTWRMILRQIQRRPIRTSFSVLGIAMAAGVVVLGSYASDALDFIVDFQFRRAQRQDLSVNLQEASPPNAVHDLQHLPGVIRVEAFRALPVRVRVGPQSRRLTLMGLETQRDIYRILDQSGNAPQLRSDGLVISEKLAELLGIRVGATVTVEVLEGRRPVADVRVVGTVDDLSGTNGFALRPFVNRIAQEGPLVSGAWLAVDPLQLDRLYSDLKATPYVVGVTAKAVSIQSFLDTIGENQLRMQGFVIGFAIVIAAGVVYNTARISLSERDRELATMRVLGFTRAEISVVLLGELGLLTIAALPVGLMMGYGMAWLSSRSVNTDLFRIPLIIAPATYGRAALVVLVSAIVSGLIVRRRLDSLDLFAVLKGQE
ncbi:MAG: ABC transporter permease [Planctomycetaceae bacterium]